MNGRAGLLAVAAILTFALFAGVYANGAPNDGRNERNVTVTACEAVPDYDYERMVSRIERIKGTRLQRNVSICVERTAGGIDTTPNRGRFARVERSGLSFFGLDATVSSRQRSSLGHAAFSPSGGPIEILLANETVVENVSWLSYEGLVAHELSHAVEVPEKMTSDATPDERATPPRTTDEILARQALSEGVSVYVTDLYVGQYGGYQNVSALNAGGRNWKHRLVESLYYRGYRYSERTDRRTVLGRGRPNSTAEILHPNETMNVAGLPARPNLSTDSLKHERTDRVGELFLREAMLSNGVSSERAVAATDGWTNDRMDYYRANDSTVVTWRVTWQSAAEANEFVEAYDAAYDYERVNAIRSIDCRESGRYLTASEETVTVLFCGNRQ